MTDKFSSELLIMCVAEKCFNGLPGIWINRFEIRKSNSLYISISTFEMGRYVSVMMTQIMTN